MQSLSQVLRDLFGPLPRRRRDPFAATLAVDGVGEVRASAGVVAALRCAIYVAGKGSGAVVFSTMPREEVATRVLRAGESDNGGMRARGDQEHLAAAAARAVSLPIWIDDLPPEVRHLHRRIGRLAAEWDTFAETGERLQRVALVVVDGWAHDDVSRGPKAAGLRAIASKLHVAILVC
jgi:hypothetical protein